jgi:NAD(P)-dependent dehydrogenase (short-subunit alcohol dehydrogenase family)
MGKRIMAGRLSGKVAIITGEPRAGPYRPEYGKEGAIVAVAARTEPKPTLACPAPSTPPPRPSDAGAKVFPWSATSPTSRPSSVWSSRFARYGRVDVLMNNAASSPGGIAMIQPKHWDRMAHQRVGTFH